MHTQLHNVFITMQLYAVTVNIAMLQTINKDTEYH